MNRPNRAAPDSIASSQATPNPWPKRLISLAVLFHLTAVVVAPLAVPPSSALFDSIRGILAFCINPMYLDHGYRFFAPEPGPSHIIRYELQLADGNRRTGQIPDRAEHRPRLLYHRHFMLSEQLPPPPEGAEPNLHGAILRSYADHLLSVNPDAQSVTLTYREHLIASPLDVQKGQRLNDPKLYQEQPLGRFTRAPERS